MSRHEFEGTDIQRRILGGDQQPNLILPQGLVVEKTTIVTNEGLQHIAADSVQALAEGTLHVLGTIRHDYLQDHTLGLQFLREQTLPFLQAAKRGLQPRTADMTEETYASNQEAANYAKVLLGRMQTIRYSHLDFADIKKDDALKAPRTQQEHIDRITEMEQALATLIQGTEKKTAVTADRSAQYRTYAFFDAAKLHNKETTQQAMRDDIDRVIEDASRELVDGLNTKINPSKLPCEDEIQRRKRLRLKREETEAEALALLGIDIEKWKARKYPNRNIEDDVKQVVEDPSVSFHLPLSPAEQLQTIENRHDERQAESIDEVYSLLGIEKPTAAPAQPEEPMNYYDRKEMVDKKFDTVFGDTLQAAHDAFENPPREENASNDGTIIFDRWQQAAEDLANILGIDPSELNEK